MTTPLPPNFNYYNGSRDSSVFLKNGDSITTASPFSVTGSGKTFTITQGLSTTTFSHDVATTTVSGYRMFTSSLGVALDVAPGPGKGASITIRNRDAIGSAAAELAVASTGDLTMNSGSATTRIEDATVICGTATAADPKIQVRGQDGTYRVYDEFYFPAPKTEIFDTARFGPSVSTCQSAPIALTAGLYQIQACVEMQNNATITLGRDLNIWLQKPTGVFPNKYRNFSEINVMSTMVSVPPSMGSSKPTFQSGIFEVDEDANWAVSIGTNGGIWTLGGAGAALHISTIRVPQ